MNELKEIEDEGLLQRKCLFFIWSMGQRVSLWIFFVERVRPIVCHVVPHAGSSVVFLVIFP